MSSRPAQRGIIDLPREGIADRLLADDIEPHHYGATLRLKGLDEGWVLSGVEGIPEFLAGLEELLLMVMGLSRVEALEETHLRITLLGRANDLEGEVAAHIAKLIGAGMPNPHSLH